MVSQTPTGRRHGVTNLRDTKSAELFARAQQYLPGGVNSPVRALRAIGRDPIFIDRAEGAELTDVDGNRYVDWMCSWGPLILGHAHPAILDAIETEVGCIEERSTLYSSTEFKKIRLLYFTEDFKNWESAHS